MNANTKHPTILLLLWLVCLAATAQQPANSDNANSSPQAVPNLDTSKTPLKTDGRVAIRSRIRTPCPAEFTLPSLPEGVFRAGGVVMEPIETKTSEATLSDEAREFIKEKHIKQFEAISIVSLTVDTSGEPQDICVRKQAGHGLDRKALESVAEYRFKPGTLHGKPVPVRLSIAIKFTTP